MKKKNSEAQVSITASHVIAWSRRRLQQPTRVEAALWLNKYRGALEHSLLSLLTEHLDQLLDEAAVVAYPDPRIDEEYQKIDHAIDEAADAYAEAMDLEIYCVAVHTGELLQLANIFSTQRPDNFRACINMEHLFGPPTNDYLNSSPTLQTRRIHIIVTNGTITVALVRDKRCRHGDDFFLPDPRGD